MKEFQFEELEDADLIVDALYRGGSSGNAGDDPISRLVYVGNQGGFRPKRTESQDAYSHVVLYSSLLDLDWPDRLDIEQGVFTYYGDNKSPGHTLETTPRGGNKLLSSVFDALHSDQRQEVHPSWYLPRGLRGAMWSSAGWPRQAYQD